MDRTTISQHQQSSAHSNSLSSLHHLTAQAHNQSTSQLTLDSPEPPITPSKDHLKEQLNVLRTKLERAEAIQRGAENLLHQVGAGQGLKRKDNPHNHDLTSQSINSAATNSTGPTGNTLHASVEAELDLANRNVKALLKEIEALENLSASSPRKTRRRLQANASAQSTPQPQSLSQAFGEDSVRIQSEIDELVKQFSTQESSEVSHIRKLSDLVSMQRGYPKLDRRKLTEIGLNGLSDSSSSDVRAESYRLLRHLVHSFTDVNNLRSSQIEFFFVKTISRDNKSDYEKLQALILVRSVAHYPGFLTLAIVRAIVSIAETADEKLRQLAIETLGELS